MKKVLLGLVAYLVALSVHAFEDNGKTITVVGIQKEYTAYFRVSEGLSQTCKHNVIYLRIDSEFGKAAYANILTAKSTGKKLSRIVYVQNPDETCHLSLVQHD